MGLVKAAEEAMKIFEKYDLQVEEVEPFVYKVINTDKEVSISELQWDLESCIMVTSDRTGFKKLPFGGVHSILAYAYYVITDFDNAELGYKYDDIATEEFGESVYRSYKYRPELANSIDTIYAKGEI